jgi:hypothetical protein
MDLIVTENLASSAKGKRSISLTNETRTVNHKAIIQARANSVNTSAPLDDTTLAIRNAIEKEEDEDIRENMRVRYLQMQSLIRLANSKLDMYINDEYVKKNEPVTVEVYMIFLRIGEIDNVKEQFQAEAYFEASWEDESVNPKETFNPKLHWEPVLIIENAVSNLKQEIKYRVENVDGKNRVFECRTIKAIFWERLELWDFPLGNENRVLFIFQSGLHKKVTSQSLNLGIFRILFSFFNFNFYIF